MARDEDGCHWIQKMMHPETLQNEEMSRIKKFWHSMGVLQFRIFMPLIDRMIQHFAKKCPNCRRRFMCLSWILYLSGFRAQKCYSAMKTVLGNCEEWEKGGMSWTFLVKNTGEVNRVG